MIWWCFFQLCSQNPGYDLYFPNKNSSCKDVWYPTGCSPLLLQYVSIQSQELFLKIFNLIQWWDPFSTYLFKKLNHRLSRQVRSSGCTMKYSWLLRSFPAFLGLNLSLEGDATVSKELLKRCIWICVDISVMENCVSRLSGVPFLCFYKIWSSLKHSCFCCRVLSVVAPMWAKNGNQVSTKLSREIWNAWADQDRFKDFSKQEKIIFCHMYEEIWVSLNIWVPGF